jgi:Kef-type K+ transport system membrane component KefB
LVVPIFFVVVGATSNVTLLNLFVAENCSGLVLAGFPVIIIAMVKLTTFAALPVTIGI